MSGKFSEREFKDVPVKVTTKTSIIEKRTRDNIRFPVPQKWTPLAVECQVRRGSPDFDQYMAMCEVLWSFQECGPLFGHIPDNMLGSVELSEYNEAGEMIQSTCLNAAWPEVVSSWQKPSEEKMNITWTFGGLKLIFGSGARQLPLE